mmetsp:Transcript_24864/g.98731  ORF Transcript_24864/g.98731 Transcript_24864/m.98731 type:complete len:386 (+) Transcript_24864:745-1902(+)
MVGPHEDEGDVAARGARGVDGDDDVVGRADEAAVDAEHGVAVLHAGVARGRGVGDREDHDAAVDVVELEAEADGCVEPHADRLATSDVWAAVRRRAEPRRRMLGAARGKDVGAIPRRARPRRCCCSRGALRGAGWCESGGPSRRRRGARAARLDAQRRRRRRRADATRRTSARDEVIVVDVVLRGRSRWWRRHSRRTRHGRERLEDAVGRARRRGVRHRNPRRSRTRPRRGARPSRARRRGPRDVVRARRVREQLELGGGDFGLPRDVRGDHLVGSRRLADAERVAPSRRRAVDRRDPFARRRRRRRRHHERRDRLGRRGGDDDEQKLPRVERVAAALQPAEPIVAGRGIARLDGGGVLERVRRARGAARRGVVGVFSGGGGASV